MKVTKNVPLLLCLISILTSCSHRDWRTSDRSSAGLAPLALDEPEAVVQVYAARAVSWRGYFAVHTWLATKARGAEGYTTYHVMGFRIKRTGSAVVVDNGIPDGRWFGAEPELINSIRGQVAEEAIEKIAKAVEEYPYKDSYRVWPGPNSNTFTSFILRRVPELGIELPPNAIGKDWINDGDLYGLTESGTGIQVSMLGLLGFSLGLAEGVEVNVLGMTFGLDFWRPALKLPFIGRLGFKDAAVFGESI